MPVRRSPRRCSSGWMLAAGLLAIPLPAGAATPLIVGRPTIQNPVFGGIANTMMYDVTVTVDSIAADPGHVGMVGFVSEDDYTTCAGTTAWKWSAPQTFDTTDARTFRLYNFVPGTTYYYRAQVGDPSRLVRARCGMLRTTAAPTPTLPTNLGYLNLQYAKTGAGDPFSTRYAMLATEDCGATPTSATGDRYYLAAVDLEAEAIVWYLDVAAMAGTDGGTGRGFRYQPGATPSEDRILATVDKRYLFEWRFDGTETNAHDFASMDECEGVAGSTGPCVHHDAYVSDVTGQSYVLATRMSGTDATGTDWEAPCGTGSRFLDDGFQILDSSWAVTSEHYLMGDYGYDPTVDGGPNAALLAARTDGCVAGTWGRAFDPAYGGIDWTHANSLTASRFGASEVVDISFKEWDQVVRFDGMSGALVWRLSPNPADSDWGTLGIAAGVTGAAAFADQHDVHATGASTVMMMDNQGDRAGARIVEIGLQRRPLGATILKSWALVDDAGDPLSCSLEGSGEYVPGTSSTRVLAMCNDHHSFAELVDATGNTGTPPPVYVYLPDGTTDPFCTTGGPAAVTDIHGWQRAFPLASVGAF
jgi:hypothetical protein